MGIDPAGASLGVTEKFLSELPRKTVTIGSGSNM